MRKEYMLILSIFVVILFTSALVSAICCEKLKDSDLWCQPATNENKCDSKYLITNTQTCDEVPTCHGTCVTKITGECSENTDKVQCEIVNKGKWYEKNPDEIPDCQESCCILGEDAYFINPTECKYLFSQNNAQGRIDDKITSRDECEKMQSSIKIGACVISTPSEKACVIKTDFDCNSNKIQELSNLLKNKPSLNEIDIKFKDGLLCTASINGIRISDCAPSEVTACKNNKVYYKDTCGNFANVYDAKKYDIDNYWTYIKDFSNPDEVCTVKGLKDITCGNCDPAEGNVCQNYRDALTVMDKPTNNQGGYVCGDLSCKVDMDGDGTKETTKKHGTSWCEGTAGTFVITENFTTGEIVKSNRTALKNADKYNIPGSRYYKLICSFGEVLVEECGNYRNSICTEGKDELGDSHAMCTFNNWRTCFELETKTSCEDPAMLCKWIPGYRWDFKEIVPEAERKQRQGSCAPLISPGFDFWKATSQGNGICGMANIQEYAMFETGIFKKRDEMKDWTDKYLSNRCVNGCFALPGYAQEFKQLSGEEKKYPEEIDCFPRKAGCSEYNVLTEFYDESKFKLGGMISDYHLSLRRGQYCNKDGDPTHWLTGKVFGNSYDCTPGGGSATKDERKERDYPIYLTHQEWIYSITERARSLGDCGYKKNTIGEYSANRTEIVTAIFQKLSQKLEVKRNITAEQVIYEGGKAVQGKLYTTDLPYEIVSYSCSSNYKGICTSTVNNQEPCSGGEANAEATCPSQRVCCVYPELS